MSGTTPKGARQKHRTRLNRLGLARFEVRGLEADRDLIRSLAKHLADDGPKAAMIRAALRSSLHDEPAVKGGILAALRRSPLVGSDLDLTRAWDNGRPVDS